MLCEKQTEKIPIFCKITYVYPMRRRKIYKTHKMEVIWQKLQKARNIAKQKVDISGCKEHKIG